MMTMGLIGWIFLVIAAIFVGIGSFVMIGGVARLIHWENCPYTRESMISAMRWCGLSLMTFGLGLVAFTLLTKVLFSIGFFSCTVGLLTFLVMLLMSRLVGAKAEGELVKKSHETVLTMEEHQHKAA